MDAKLILRVENLVKRYGGLTAVDRASFAVREGTITGLIGPNGAGKTTTFDIIAGAQKPTEGRITYDGRDITGMATHQLFHLGIVRSFQIPREYGRLTVIENLMVAPPDQPGESVWATWFTPGRCLARERAVMQRAEETLDFLGLTHLREELAKNLSGGQKKLLELGRAMMTDSRLVLLDEPGAGVNPTLMNKIIDLIERLNRERGYTFCIVEHDMDLVARLCDPVIVLVEGAVLTEGPFAQVSQDSRVIDAYFGGGTDSEAAA
ncbi:MAG TPA: ABC transporter ATP-binding protein [Thermohalobaculum sp.]|nr:ABC transporter ATP-binding protein [Thermohalobaculum sp.]